MQDVLVIAEDFGNMHSPAIIIIHQAVVECGIRDLLIW